MPLTFSCPTCQAALRKPDAFAGKQIVCPKCQSTVGVPSRTVPPASPPLADEPAPPRAPAPRPTRTQARPAPERLTVFLGLAAIALALFGGYFAWFSSTVGVAPWSACGTGLALGLLGFLISTFSRRGSAGGQFLSLAGIGLNLVLGVLAVFWLLGQEVQWQKDQHASATNLVQIGQAMHEYHDSFKRFPMPKSGEFRSGPKPGELSWRVAILPYLKHERLQAQFRLYEPWDSPHNKKILETVPMPEVYKSPRQRPDEQNKTYYQVFVGGGAIWKDGNDRPTLQRITDGTSFTFMIVEAKTPVYWTQAEDIAFDGQTVPPLGGIFDGGFHALMADGSVGWVGRDRLSDATLKAFITHAGGEAIGPDEMNLIEWKTKQR